VTWFHNHLFIVYRESDRHMSHHFTRICLIQWTDDLHEIAHMIVAESYYPKRLNCPRLSVINDTLWLICDEIDVQQGEDNEEHTRVFLWKSSNGHDWSRPIDTQIHGIVPDRICPTKNGFLIATHTRQPQDNSTGFLVQNVWHAPDLEGAWQKYPLCHKKGHNFCEASICQLLNGSFLALMRENSAKGLPAFACHSRNGIKWSAPRPTKMFGCHRPVTGLLKSGNLLTTYREASHAFIRGLWAKNTFACLTKPTVKSPGTERQKNKNNRVDFSLSIILPLDHDINPHSDSGYTGWVQLPDDSIFIVNYITNTARFPYIVWYRIDESDF